MMTIYSRMYFVTKYVVKLVSSGEIAHNNVGINGFQTLTLEIASPQGRRIRKIKGTKKNNK